MKVRAREYYEQHSVCAKDETAPRELVFSNPYAWCAVKQRLGERTQKHRFRLGKVEVPTFFRGEHVAFRARAAADLPVWTCSEEASAPNGGPDGLPALCQDHGSSHMDAGQYAQCTQPYARDPRDVRFVTPGDPHMGVECMEAQAGYHT